MILEWLIVHNMGGILAIPSLHTVTKHQGMNVPTLEKQDKKSSLVVMPLAWVHSRVATCWSPAAPRALLSWLCWGLPVPDPHDLVVIHPILSLFCSFLYSTFTWTGPAGALSICNSFLPAACCGSAPVSSATPLPLLPWEEKMVQYHGSLEMLGTWGG